MLQRNKNDTLSINLNIEGPAKPVLLKNTWFYSLLDPGLTWCPAINDADRLELKALRTLDMTNN